MGDRRILVSTSYFPPIGYISSLFHAQEAYIELQETFPKQTYRNHCCIYGPNGRQVLTVPVNRIHGNHTRTSDVLISCDSEWQKNHWRSIEAAYNNSPFFFYYMDLFKPLFTKRFKALYELNSSVLEVVRSILDFNCRISFTETFQKIPPGVTDLRRALTSKHAVFKVRTYSQTFGEKFGFIPNLSILDLIFNCGPEAREFLDQDLSFPENITAGLKRISPGC